MIRKIVLMFILCVPSAFAHVLSGGIPHNAYNDIPSAIDWDRPVLTCDGGKYTIFKHAGKSRTMGVWKGLRNTPLLEYYHDLDFTNRDSDVWISSTVRTQWINENGLGTRYRFGNELRVDLKSKTARYVEWQRTTFGSTKITVDVTVNCFRMN